MKVRNYIIDKEIGKGENSEVRLARKEGSLIFSVCKKYERSKIEGKQIIKILEYETNVLKSLKDQNVIELLDILKTKTHFYLIYEYCNGGNLLDILEKYEEKNGKPFSEKIVQYLMKQIINGIKYIHRKELIHGDLKLQSIFIIFNNDKDKEELDMMKATVKIAHFKKCKKQSNDDLKFVEATFADYDYDYERKHHYQKTDILDLGIICYKMLLGKNASKSKDTEVILNELKSGNNNSIALSEEVISFLENLMNKNSFKRFNIDQTYEHPFLKKEYL